MAPTVFSWRHLAFGTGNRRDIETFDGRFGKNCRIK